MHYRVMIQSGRLPNGRIHWRLWARCEDRFARNNQEQSARARGFKVKTITVQEPF